MKLATAILVACVALGFAQVPRRCTSPKAWEARVVGYQFRENFGFFGKFYYDAENNRTSYTFEEMRDGQLVENEMVYNFYKERVKYVYNIETRTCKSYPLTGFFRPIGIPSTARYLDTHVIGTNAIEKFGVTINIWEDNPRPDTRIYMDYVADDFDGDENCYPTSSSEFSPEQGYYHEEYYNIVEGYNPDHFIQPEVCPPPVPPPK